MERIKQVEDIISLERKRIMLNTCTMHHGQLSTS